MYKVWRAHGGTCALAPPPLPVATALDYRYQALSFFACNKQKPGWSLGIRLPNDYIKRPKHSYCSKGDLHVHNFYLVKSYLSIKNIHWVFPEYWELVTSSAITPLLSVSLHTCNYTVNIQCNIYIFCSCSVHAWVLQYSVCVSMCPMSTSRKDVYTTNRRCHQTFMLTFLDFQLFKKVSLEPFTLSFYVLTPFCMSLHN